MWQAVNMPGPASEPVTVAEVKAALSIAGNDYDQMIEGYISAARAHVETFVGERIVPRAGVVMRCETFDDLGEIPEGPVKALTSVQVMDPSGAPVTIAIDGEELPMWPATMPGAPIIVTADIGYDTCPPELAEAVKLLAVHWTMRELANSHAYGLSVSAAVDALIASYKA